MRFYEMKYLMSMCMMYYYHYSYDLRLGQKKVLGVLGSGSHDLYEFGSSRI